MADAQPPVVEESLSPLQLADGLLENVAKCPDCAKPVLQSAMADHQATCQAIREGRVPDASLKRRLSEVSNGSSVPPKKSKLVLHLGGPAASPAPEKPKLLDVPKKNKRVVDVDRQCGVINDKGYPCPRSLTCKTHNMSAKRAVPGRVQPYDLLLFEWQKANKANQQKADAAKQAQPGALGVASVAGTTRASAAAQSDASTPLAAPPLTAEPSASGLLSEPPRAKRKRSGGVDAISGGGASGGYKLPGEKKGKKGIVYVGEWEESDDEGADELVDSDEEVEAVLRGLSRAEHGRPLYIARGGGAGFSTASMFTGRNAKLARLRGTLRDIFRPAA
ncbi:SAGA complex subunit Sgf73 [Rhodotorula kratochvilovae]